ncbi:MAG TPA: ABC transporter permease [Gemmataceae bacterium]|nr:ABC transporter permease [Gemmataceae bacterium]
MSAVTEARTISRRDGDSAPSDADFWFELLSAIPQFFLGLLPRTCHRVLVWLIGRPADEARGFELLLRSGVALVLGGVIFFFLYVVSIAVFAAWARLFPTFVQFLADKHVIEPDSGWLSLIPKPPIVLGMYSVGLVYLTGLFVRTPYDEFARRLRVFRGMVWLRTLIARLAGYLCLMGLGLLPLASLLMFLPIVMPEEAVLTDTVSPARTFLKRFLRRAFAFLAGVTLFLALLTFATQVVTWTGLSSAVYGEMARQLIGPTVTDRLPRALVQGWPFVFLIMYATDFLLLFGIGRVPLSYNFRNLRVRWITTLMTGIAFTVVVALLILMSSFVDSVNRLTASSGIPGNVFVLSEGATDELFSNLGYGDVGKLDLETATDDPQGRPLAAPLTVKSSPGKPGQQPVRWCSKETYFVINQEIAKPAGGGPTRRFVQLRGIEDAEVALKVHDITLLKGDPFGSEGAVRLSDGSTAVPCALGEGAAAAFGADYGRERLDVGDTFMLGDTKMVVAGVMKSAGRTFDSETWATNARVSKAFGKQAFTTVVLRVSDDGKDSAQQSAETMAYHLTKNFTNPRVRAVSETRYYEDLAKSNSQLMYLVTVVALIMSLGGIIGVMLVMFAAIAQRIKDIGVMRVVGYKRWQILVSFMLESLAIALIGGLIAVLLIVLVDAAATATQGGLTVTTNVSAGQGSGKTVVTKLVFGTDVLAGGILFTIIMGRLGGLLPSVGAMRLGILESLR